MALTTPQEILSPEIEQQQTVANPPVAEQVPSPALEGEVEVDPFADDQANAIPLQEEKNEQVAGLFTGISRAKRVMAEEILPDGPPPPAAHSEPLSRIQGQRIIITDASESDVRFFQEALDRPFEEGVKVARPNLDHHNLEDTLKDYIRAIHEIHNDAIDAARRGTMTIKEIAAEAGNVGMDDAATWLLRQPPGAAFNPEQMALAIRVRLNTQVLLDEVMTNGDHKGILKTLAFAASVEAKVSGGIAEAGRSMAVLSNAGKIGAMDTSRLQSLPELLKRYNVETGDIDNMRAAYLALPTNRRRAKYTKGLMRKGLDVWAELYINSLLSSPVTHMVNIASNLVFGLFQLPERALAGVFGALRTNIFRGMTSADRVYMMESVAMIQSLRQGMQDAFVASSRALIREEETFGKMAKIDTRERRAITSEFLGFDPQSPVGMAADATGVFTRFLGARMLLAEDEFAKGLAYQAEIYAQAHRRMTRLIDDGMAPEDAAREGAAILAGRDATAVKNAQEMAQRLTFQGDLGKFAGALSKIMSHPLAKIFVPFYKTPTNIIKETIQRTPLGILPGSPFWTDFRKGGANADLAMSRLTMGSGLFMTFAWSAAGAEGSNLMLTGSGPRDKTAKAAWRRMNLQPYSIAIKNDDGTYTSYDYSRLAPIAGILAMAADYAAYSQYEDDAGTLEELFVGGSLALFEHMADLPMMEGFFTIAELFGSEYEGMHEKIPRTLDLLAKQITGALVSSIPLVPTGSLAATIERVLYPEASNTMPSGDDIDLPLGVRGFYEGLQKALSRNPFFSKDVPNNLNLWAEEMKSCENGLWCFISPIRVIDSKYNEVDEEMVRLGLGVPMPKKTQRGIMLNAEQYNRLIMEMNFIDHDGMNMLDEMSWLISQDHYQEAPIGTNEEDGSKGKIDMLRSVKNARLKEALDTLFGEDIDLEIKAGDRAIAIEDTGQAP